MARIGEESITVKCCPACCESEEELALEPTRSRDGGRQRPNLSPPLLRARCGGLTGDGVLFPRFFWWAPPNTAPFFYDAGLETPGDSLNNGLFTITVFSFVWALSAGGTVVIVMWICCTKAM
jgi:hypothetical protein